MATEEQSPKKAIRLLLTPEIDEHDGTWTARYPGENWSVTGDSRQRVIDNLVEEHERRATTRESMDSLLALVDRSRIAPIPGVEVEALTEDEYQQRVQETAQLSDQDGDD